MTILRHVICLLAVTAFLAACVRTPATYRLELPGADVGSTGNLRVSFSPPAFKATLYIDQAPVAELDEAGGVERILIRGVAPGVRSVEVRSFNHEAQDVKSAVVAEGEVTDLVLRGPEAQSKGQRNTGLIVAGIALTAGFVLLFIVLANSLESSRS